MEVSGWSEEAVVYPRGDGSVKRPLLQRLDVAGGGESVAPRARWSFPAGRARPPPAAVTESALRSRPARVAVHGGRPSRPRVVVGLMPHVPSTDLGGGGSTPRCRSHPAECSVPLRKYTRTSRSAVACIGGKPPTSTAGSTSSRRVARGAAVAGAGRAGVAPAMCGAIASHGINRVHAPGLPQEFGEPAVIANGRDGVVTLPVRAVAAGGRDAARPIATPAFHEGGDGRRSITLAANWHVTIVPPVGALDGLRGSPRTRCWCDRWRDTHARARASVRCRRRAREAGARVRACGA